MKANLKITIKGQSSETKEELAEDLKKFLLDRGYGKVWVSGEDKNYPYDGLFSDESIEISI